MKHCNRCHADKEPIQFYKRRLSPDGLAYTCKSCCDAVYRKFKSENPGKARQYSATYYRKHPERQAARSAEWKKRNKGRIHARHVEKRMSDHAATLAAEAAYREANREKLRESQNAWYARHRDKALAISAAKRSRRAGAEGHHTAQEIRDLRSNQKGCCAICRANLKDTGEHKDHIMPLILGGSNYIENIQLLCPMCNLQKRDKHPEEFMRSRGLLL